MLSKWQIWDFFSSNNRDVFKTHEGLLALKTFDPISLKLVKDYLLRGFDKNVLHHKLGSEVTKSWIEEEFLTLSLFGNSDNFFIHQSNDILAVDIGLNSEKSSKFSRSSYAASLSPS
jgi:hypothetical protein